MSTESTKRGGWIKEIQLLVLEVKELFLSGLRELVLYKWWILGTAVVLALVIYLVMPHDRTLLNVVRNHDGGEPVRQLARQISFWGDFLTGVVPATLVLLLLSWVCHKPKWRTAALSFILASALAGIAVNSLRLTLGRPRPSAELPDGFYGLKRKSSYHGFPSGHAATAFGGATALAVVWPPVGIPTLVIAGSVGWSRMELRRHYPTDILAGGFIGIVCGLALGRAARQIRSRGVSHPPEK